MLFTEAELSYLESQTLGRLATIDRRGTPQNSPVSFRYNAETGTIDIGGRALGDSRKYRNVIDNPRVSFIIDDIASVQPWRVRAVEVRGHAVGLEGQAPLMPHFSDEVIRIYPERIIAWGIEPGSPGIHARSITHGSSA